MHIRTNNQYRSLLSSDELTEQELKEFDYMDEEELQLANFFRYHGIVYSLDAFMRCPTDGELASWHGYMSDSFFSGILIKYSSDCEQIKVATFYS